MRRRRLVGRLCGRWRGEGEDEGSTRRQRRQRRQRRSTEVHGGTGDLTLAAGGEGERAGETPAVQRGKRRFLSLRKQSLLLCVLPAIRPLTKRRLLRCSVQVIRVVDSSTQIEDALPAVPAPARCPHGGPRLSSCFACRGRCAATEEGRVGIPPFLFFCPFFAACPLTRRLGRGECRRAPPCLSAE